MLTLFVTATVLDLVEAVGTARRLRPLRGLTLAALWLTAVYVPETEGRSLEQIEADMHG